MAATKRKWLVRVRATVLKEIVCVDCTEEQAADDPYNFSVEETELEQTDFHVESVQPDD